MESNFKGVWIPKEIWLSHDLSMSEKFFLLEINSLDNDNGCFASNAHFAELFNLTKQRSSQIINSLEKKKYIKTTLIREGKQVKKRIIKVSNKFDRGIKKISRGCQENVKGNNTNEYRESIKGSRFIKPTIEEIVVHMKDKSEAENFYHFYESKNWMVGKNKMQIWKSAATGWMNRKEKNEKNKQYNQSSKNKKLEESNQELFNRAQQLEREAELEENRGGISEVMGLTANALSAAKF